MLSVTDFDPKGVISGVRVQAGLCLDLLDADRSPNAVSVHAYRNFTGGFRSWPPATCTTRTSFDHHGKRSGSLHKKWVSKNEKKGVSLSDLKVLKTRNDCEIACDCVKRANVVIHVGLWKEIFARKHTATQKPTSAQPLYSYQRDIHLTRSLVAKEPPGLLWQT